MVRRPQTVVIYTIEKNHVIKSEVLPETVIKNSECIASIQKNPCVKLYESDDEYIIISEKRAIVIKKDTPEAAIIELLLMV